MRIATIVTANPARAEQAAGSYPSARVEASVEAVWDDADRHDFVVIATPNDSHVPLALRAIEAGLPVVVDKPLASSSAAARELAERAASAGVLLTVFHNRRWDSELLTLRRLIAEGELGEVFRFESRFERWRPGAPGEAWRESSTRAEGGGVLLDLGTHLVDQALTLFGPVAEVHGEVRRVRGGPADDDAFLFLRHAAGVCSHIWASSVAATTGPRMRVMGDRGAFVVDELDGQEDALKAGMRPDQVAWGEEPEGRWGRLIRGDEVQRIPAANGDWPEFYRRLGIALRGEGRVPVDPHDAVAVLEILERATGPG
jgi:scyllo-inositol 2-dehydrogenase (NADP+)